MRGETQLDRSLPLPIAFVLAVAAHGGVFAMLAQARPEGGRLPMIRGEIAPEDVNAPRDDDPEEIPLGIDANTPSSMTWIGYEQFEEHLARLSEVEQAALDESPSGGGGGTTPVDRVSPEGASADAAQADAASAVAPATVDHATVPEETPPDSATPTPASAGGAIDPTPAAAEAATAASTAAPAPPSVAPPALPPTSDSSSATPPAVTPDGTLPLAETQLPTSLGPWSFGRSTPDDAPPMPDGATAAQPDAGGATGIAPRDGDGDSERDVDASTPRPATSLDGTTKPEAASADAAPPATATPQPAAAGAPGASGATSAPGPAGDRPNTQGDQSDRESDPTSLVDVPPDQWRKGKPLAARGIEIKTKRPVFPELTRLTSAPANPIVEILFDRNGVPRKARVLRSSGDPRVDGPVVDSLYRWRATGEALSRLREGETLRIEMRLLLGG